MSEIVTDVNLNDGVTPVEKGPPENLEVAEDSPKKSVWPRLLALVGLLGGLYAVGHYTGFIENFDQASLKTWVKESGPLGFLGLIAAFSVGMLLQVPGMLFVGVSIWVYGQTVGGILAHIGGVVALSVSFLVARTVGGRPLGAMKNKWAVKIFDRLDEHPISTVVILRLIFWFGPPINYALAFSNIKFRDYLIGSALGLIPIVAIVAVFFESLSRVLGDLGGS
ncbi:MAG: VTT domain-containing protein [Planctomycetota bacterium]|nr:VTT domain-containing protein [Planctomycetota bacterium]